jgi:L-amino acid N-acyltransferase YncA
MFVVAPSEVSAQGKESLVSLLETAESMGCHAAYMCVDKSNANRDQMIRMFLYLGFELVDARTDSNATLDGFVVLGYDLQ